MKMTEKQIQRVKDKIDRIKKTLAAEKKKFGGYDDSRGLRYLPPELYLKIQDYQGASRYFTWFKKNFPNDCGFPDFLFEWTVTLFKNKKLKEAELKAFEAYFQNTYLFDKFLNDQINPIEKEELAGYERPEAVAEFPYSSQQAELSDFSQWLEWFTKSERFKTISADFIAIQKQLQNERPGPKRDELLKRKRNLL